MTRTLTVRLRTGTGTVLEDVGVSVVATDDAAVDMARRQAGISPDQFETGKVVA
ncbi:hypothetical protein [Halorubrum aidingense]|uniref:hypothetical protein n=1 Tax=Halorubrum aidingense TaxID=368623 RepID=UPI000AE2476A|nr:hypothetical protein [Halorubrum aidingense]